MSDCERKGKFWGGCRFIPIYDEKPNIPLMQSGGQFRCSDPRDLLILTEYAGSLCTRCGKETRA